MGTKVYFADWKGCIVDNRNKPFEQWSEMDFIFPLSRSENTKSKAFIGWAGFAIFNESVNIVRLLTQYSAQYQKYSEACGRCSPGRWGGRILYDILHKILSGYGSINDLDCIKEISSTMMQTSKCEIGKTVPIPIIKGVEHFRGVFLDLIKNGKTSKLSCKIDESKFISKVTAPCTDACPSHIDIPAYIEGVRDLNYEYSLKVTRANMPLANVCARVCPHPCEDECRRANIDEPISIMELKRMGADYEYKHNLPYIHPKTKKNRIGKKVAIIGGGPAGLTASYYLSLDGIDCDVYEALPVLGGEVTVGVPEYRMPIDRYNKDIDLIRELGVNFILNTKVDSSMMREFEKEYDAILIAVGARISKKVRSNNERLEINGYWPAIDFLDKINLNVKYGIGDKIDISGKSVVCIGGGFTSMDVVRCSIRANAKRVTMIYRRDEDTIIQNTTKEEYLEAIEEGVDFIFHTSIEDIITDERDNLKKIKVNKLKLMPDPNYPKDKKRARLIKMEDGDSFIECDYLIPAVSQDCDLSLLPKEWDINMTRWSTIKTDGRTFETSKKGVFAAGDCEYGPLTIVNAVGQAKRASSVISRYLKTSKVTLSSDEVMEDALRALGVYSSDESIKGWMSDAKRQDSKKLFVEQRVSSNREVNFGLSVNQAVLEAQRCMRCYYIAMVEL